MLPLKLYPGNGCIIPLFVSRVLPPPVPGSGLSRHLWCKVGISWRWCWCDLLIAKCLGSNAANRKPGNKKHQPGTTLLSNALETLLLGPGSLHMQKLALLLPVSLQLLLLTLPQCSQSDNPLLSSKSCSSPQQILTLFNQACFTGRRDGRRVSGRGCWDASQFRQHHLLQHTPILTLFQSFHREKNKIK